MPNPFRGVSGSLIGIIVPNLVKADWGSNRICRYITGQGLKFRRQTLLDYIREEKFVKTYAGDIALLDPRDPTPRGLMVETKLGKNRNYRIYGEATYKNIETGEVKEHKVSVYTNDNLDEDEFNSAVIDAHDETESDPDYEIVGVERVRVDHFRGRPY